MHLPKPGRSAGTAVACFSGVSGQPPRFLAPAIRYHVGRVGVCRPGWQARQDVPTPPKDACQDVQQHETSPRVLETSRNVTQYVSVNDRLRTAMLHTGTSTEELAVHCGVDVKTAERWISPGRVPHRQHRWAAARCLGCDEDYLWPQAARSPARRAEASQSELVRLYPDRASVPRETWIRLMTGAREHVSVLVFSGTFYAQTQPKIARMISAAAGRGVQVRLCFGDPRSDAVAARDREEGLGGTLAAKICSSLTYYRQIAASGECEVRLHATTLYASLFRYDDEIMVNPHAWGEPASANPALHLRRLDGGQVAAHYMNCFERVWATARPWHGDDI